MLVSYQLWGGLHNPFQPRQEPGDAGESWMPPGLALAKNSTQNLAESSEALRLMALHHHSLGRRPAAGTQAGDSRGGEAGIGII